MIFLFWQARTFGRLENYIYLKYMYHEDTPEYWNAIGTFGWWDPLVGSKLKKGYGMSEGVTCDMEATL